MDYPVSNLVIRLALCFVNSHKLELPLDALLSTPLPVFRNGLKRLLKGLLMTLTGLFLFAVCGTDRRDRLVVHANSS